VGFFVCFPSIIMINFHSDNLGRPEKKLKNILTNQDIKISIPFLCSWLFSFRGGDGAYLWIIICNIQFL